MAKNLLTPEQDILTRQFYAEVAQHAESLLTNTPAYGRQLRAILCLLLNYDQLPNGSFVTKGQAIHIPFGSTDFSAYEDEWVPDTETALAGVAINKNEKTNDTHTGETSASEPSEDTEVREAILPEDVS